MNSDAGAGLQPLWAALLAQDPNAPLLEFEGAAFSRAGFEALIAQATERLRETGLGRGHIVAWLGHNSPQMLAQLLACERHGCVFMPLNWRLSTAELAQQLQHAGAQVLWGTPELATLAAPLQAHCGTGGAPAPEADDLLLVYTSGTTGQPKGALHTASGMRANLAAALAAQGFEPGTRVLSALPLFHVGGLCIQTLPALLSGAVLHLQARFSPGAWFDALEAGSPHTSLLVPAMMRALVEHPRWADAPLQRLRFICSGSSIVPRALIDTFHQRGVPVAQVYGATETGPVSIVLRPDQALAHPGKAGWPALGVQVRLVDEQGGDVPPGAVGEICLRAPNLMRSYHRSGDGASFVDGWFHSGDLAHCDAQGCFEVVGRRKDMIISGGENIYPAEIENIVQAWPGVAECAVVGLPHPRWGEVPALALVAAAGAAIDLDALRAHLAARLARYKQPQQVALLAELPKTALGKVRKEHLPPHFGTTIAPAHD